MDTRRTVSAIITWEIDPSRLSVHEWIRDIIVDFGERGAWTVLVKIIGFIDGTWDTYADIAFIVDEAPWHLLEPGFIFKLWAGKEIAMVTIR